MSRGARAWLISLGISMGVLGLPLTAPAGHARPGSDVPWALLLVAGVAIFAAAWALTRFFERREERRSTAPGPRENAR